MYRLSGTLDLTTLTRRLHRSLVRR
jgi:hypothetical protein